MKLKHATIVCLVIATATASAQQHAAVHPGLVYWVPVLRQPAPHAPLAAAKANSAVPASQVITQGLHLGDNADPEVSGYADDTPASVITQGPHPGSYTSVSSDEPSEATQFHSQDGRGQFLFGHSSPEQARIESRSADGTVRGSYSYINPEGRTIKVSYTAGEGGFQPVEEDTVNGVFPKPVTETPEVKAARALHARLFDQARWLAESSPAEDEVPHQDNGDHAHHNDSPTPSPPVSSVPGDSADPFYTPDSLYTNVGAVGVESDDSLEYYGAAKGTPISYSGKFTPNIDKNTPLAYTGAYHFPQHFRIAEAPVLSAYSAPSLREQQHLHRTIPSADVSDEREKSAKITTYSAPSENVREQQHLHRASLGPSEGVKPQYYSAFHAGVPEYIARAALDNLEYYGAAKLLAYSTANLLYNNEKQGSHRGGKSLTLPTQGNPETFFSSYRQMAPVYVAVAPQPEQDDVPSTRTALGDNTQPAVPPASVSQKAAFFGAAPVAAVHDAQVAPGQQVKDHQKLPVYIEAN